MPLPPEEGECQNIELLLKLNLANSLGLIFENYDLSEATNVDYGNGTVALYHVYNWYLLEVETKYLPHLAL